MDPAAVADEVDLRIRGLDAPSVDTVRRVRRDVSGQLRGESGADVVAVALALVGGSGGWRTSSCTTTPRRSTR